MKNIVLTEEQFDKFLRYKLAEAISINNGVDEAETAFAKDNGRRILDYLKNLYNSEDENDAELSGNLRRLAAQHAVNFDYSEDEYKKRQLETKNEEIKNWVCDNLPLLRSCWIGNSFMKSKERAQYDTKTKSVSNSFTPTSKFDTLSDEDKRTVSNLGIFLDKVGLSGLYRDYQYLPSKKYICGVDVTKVDKRTSPEFLRQKLNFFGIITGDEKYSEEEATGIEDELKKYYTDGRVEKLNNLAGFDDEKNRASKNNSQEWSSIASIAAEQLAEKRTNLYLRATYGMDLSFGEDNKMFKFGNTKVPEDTLIVNFTSAIRCPAWNECIMKDACYAKTSEMNYSNTLYSNTRKNVIWEQTREDKTLMKLMMALLRSYLFDYGQLEVAKQYKRGDEQKDFMWGLCQKTLYEIRDEYGQEAIDTLAETKRGTLIRLNENGDFIGQWLVDAFEDFAKEFDDLKVGVHITAYTCRALNYEAVEHMILNISQQALVNGQNSKGFAHFFYAIDPKDYSRLGETYGGPNYEMDFNEKTKKITPVYRKLVDKGVLKGYYYKCPCGRGKYAYVDIEETKSAGTVSLRSVENLSYNEANGTFNGEVNIDGNVLNAAKIGTKYFKPKYLYDRTSGIMYVKNGSSKTYSRLNSEKVDYGTSTPLTIDAVSPELFINVSNGVIYLKREVKDSEIKNVADCYMCRICYARDAEKDVKFEGGQRVEGVPIFVFVATHGANKNEFQTPEGRKIAGKFPGEWADILNGKDNNVQQPVEALQEEYEGTDEQPQNDKRAIEGIAKRFAFSVANQMRKSTPVLEEIKKKFNDIFDRING